MENLRPRVVARLATQFRLYHESKVLGQGIDHHKNVDEKSNEATDKVLGASSPAPRLYTVPEKFTDKINSFTRNADPQALRQRVSRLYRSLSTGQGHELTEESADVEANIMGTFLQNYANLSATMLEAKARMPSFAPETILDVGFGPATGVLAASEVFPSIKTPSAVIFGHLRMKRKAQELLEIQGLNCSFKTEVPSMTATSSYDLIVAAHQLYHGGSNGKDIITSHAQRLLRLLNPGGMLIFMERGDPVGAETIAYARQVLIRPESPSKDAPPGWVRRESPAPDQTSRLIRIVAPCAHHKACPLQAGLLNRQNQKNPGGQYWCHFNQSVLRPTFTMELKKGKYLAQPWTENTDEYSRGVGGKALKGHGRPFGNNKEVGNFSYLIVQRSESAQPATPPPQLPRILQNPNKLHHHIIMRMCAPSGDIEQWSVTKSQGKETFRAAKKAKNNDIWDQPVKNRQIRGGLKHKYADGGPSQNKSVDFWEPPKQDLSVVEELGMHLQESDFDSQRAEKTLARGKSRRHRNWTKHP